MTPEQKKVIADAVVTIRDWCAEQDCHECPYYDEDAAENTCRFADGYVPADWTRPTEKASDEVQPPTEEELYAALRTIKRQCASAEDCSYCALHYTERNCFITDFDAPMEWNMQRRMPDGTLVKLV